MKIGLYKDGHSGRRKFALFYQKDARLESMCKLLGKNAADKVAVEVSMVLKDPTMCNETRGTTATTQF